MENGTERRGRSVTASLGSRGWPEAVGPCSGIRARRCLSLMNTIKASRTTEIVRAAPINHIGDVFQFDIERKLLTSQFITGEPAFNAEAGLRCPRIAHIL